MMYMAADTSDFYYIFRYHLNDLVLLGTLERFSFEVFEIY